MSEEVKNEGWEEVQSDMGKTIRWKETPKDDKEAEKTIFIGTKVQGVYTGKKENIGENSATIYQILTLEHGLVGVWATTVLADKMSKVWEGNEVVITMTGDQKPKSGGKAYMLFTVQQRPASQELLDELQVKKAPEEKDEVSVEDVPFN